MLANAHMARKRRMQKVLDEGEEKNSSCNNLANKFTFNASKSEDASSKLKKTPNQNSKDETKSK